MPPAWHAMPDADSQAPLVPGSAERVSGQRRIGYDPMPPCPRPTVPVDTASRRHLARIGLVVVLSLLLAACAASGTPDVSFDPSTACAAATDQGHYPGA